MYAVMRPFSCCREDIGWDPPEAVLAAVAPMVNDEDEDFALAHPELGDVQIYRLREGGDRMSVTPKAVRDLSQKRTHGDAENPSQCADAFFNCFL